MFTHLDSAVDWWIGGIWHWQKNSYYQNTFQQLLDLQASDKWRPIVNNERIVLKPNGGMWSHNFAQLTTFRHKNLASATSNMLMMETSYMIFTEGNLRSRGWYSQYLFQFHIEEFAGISVIVEGHFLTHIWRKKKARTEGTGLCPRLRHPVPFVYFIQGQH